MAYYQLALHPGYPATMVVGTSPLKAGLRLVLPALVALALAQCTCKEQAPAARVPAGALDRQVVLVDDWMQPGLPDSEATGWLTEHGAGSVLLLRDQVGDSAPLRKIVARLEVSEPMRQRLLERLTDGVIKIYFDLGASPRVWNNNVKLFEQRLAARGAGSLAGPPDLVILSHAHWPNYAGGLESIVAAHPEVLFLLTPDMARGLLCFDQGPEGPVNGRWVLPANAHVLRPGVNRLSPRLALVTLPFRRPWPNLDMKEGKLYKRRQASEQREYETLLSVASKGGTVLFGTCLHTSLLKVLRTLAADGIPAVTRFVGGWEEDPGVLAEVRRAHPEFLFRVNHCAPPGPAPEGAPASSWGPHRLGAELKLPAP